MRSEDDIQHAFGTFDALDRPELLRSQGDNFRYGMWAGKLMALEWVLGSPIDFLSIHHDYESWVAEMKLHQGGEICAKCGTEIRADEKPVRHGDSVICQECAKAENAADD